MRKTSHHRLAGFALVAGLCLGLGAGRAAADPVVLLETLGCHSPPASYQTDLRAARLLMLMSAWDGRDLAALAARAGIAPEARAARASAAQIAAAHPDLVARIEADITGFGAAICPAARLATSADLDDLMQAQDGFRSFHHPVVQGAQRLAYLHGCGPADFDGAFGPASRAAHARLVTAATGLAPDPDSLVAPDPAMLTRLARQAVSTGLCMTSGAQGTTGPALAPLPLLDPALGHEGYLSSWLELRDPTLVHLLEGAGGPIGAAHADGAAIPAYQERLSLWLAQALRPAAPESLLADILGRGVGVQPDRDASAFWRARALAAEPPPDAHDQLVLARLQRSHQHAMRDDATPDAIDAAVGALIDALTLIPWNNQSRFGPVQDWEHSDRAFADPATGADIAEWLMAEDVFPIRPTAASMALRDVAPLAWLAALTLRSEAAEAQVLARADPQLLSWLGWQLLETGAGSGPRDPIATAARLLGHASDQGEVFATSRLAFMALHGRGVPQDTARARALARTAAARKDPFAAYLLARIADDAVTGSATDAALQDIAESYVRAVARDGEIWLPLVTPVANRLTDPDSHLSTPAGAQALRKAVAESGSLRLAQALADAALCTSCGGAVVPEDAADWLRLADDLAQVAMITRNVRLDAASGLLEGEYHDRALAQDITRPARTLYRLLAQRPELALHPDEGHERLRRVAADTLPGSGQPAESWFAAGLLLELDGADRQQAEMVLARFCTDASDPACTVAARIMASGEMGTPAIGPAIMALQAADDIELVDLLAAFGDFEGALAAARRHGKSAPGGLLHSWTLAELGNQRGPTLRRLLAGRSADALASLPPALQPYLSFLAASGDRAAARYLRLLDRHGGARDDMALTQRPQNPETALAEHDAQTRRGALSAALAHTARTAATALAASGDSPRAVDLELVALRTELALAEISALRDGPFRATMSAACHLARSSERLQDLEQPDLALVLAKEAVNQLQELRRDLAGMPENLQVCFRDLVAENYRWLAGLFIAQDRFDEAERIIAMLKDYETFQFVDRDRDLSGRGFDALPLGDRETALRDGLAALRLPLGPAAREAAELRNRRASAGLDAADTARLAELDAELAIAARDFKTALQGLRRAAQKLDRAEVTAQLDGLGPLQGHLRHGAEARAVALHYVVLPDRLGVILTTPELRIGHTITEWGGAPFSEARLDAMIAEFHDLLSTPDRDPRGVAQELHALLLGPLAQEIAAVAPDLMLLSLDRRLRYLPFAALHDGDGFLAERHAIAVLSQTPYEMGGQREDTIRTAALGASNAAEGFSALPGVDLELAGLVRGADAFGLFEGRTWRNAEFDATALEDALRIGGFDGLGMVHVASHFQLGRTEDDSFLVLGTGERLSLSVLRENPLAYDFGGVGLLTLSACATGFADPAQDGRELESLASITGQRGARSVLASLWPVQDNTTSILMQRFYELQASGLYSRAEALALVQREFITDAIGTTRHLPGESIALASARRGSVSLLRDHDGHALGIGHPFYWAPFTLTGNWR